MARPLTRVVTSQLFTLTCLGAVLLLVPYSMTAETDTASEPSEEAKKEPSFEFTASPETIVGEVTKTLNIRCALDEDKEINGKVSAIQVKQGGEVIASVTPEEAKGFTDGDQLTVKGSIKENGNRFLSLTWSEPGKAQAGKFQCEIVIKSLSGKEKKLSQLTKVRYSKPSIKNLVDGVKELLKDEMAGFNKKVDKLREDVDDEVSDLASSIKALRKYTDSAIQGVTDDVDKKDKAIVSTINGLRQQTNLAIRNRVPVVFRGDRPCTSAWINFPRPYSRTPFVFASFYILGFSTGDVRVRMVVSSVTTNRFYVQCYKLGNTYMLPETRIQWMSIER